MKELFITATDTDAGKTFVSCALIQALSQLKNDDTGKTTQVAAFKPVAAGCELIAGQLINEDAKLLSEFSNCGQSIKQINPIAFQEAIAPHIAAKKHQQVINLADISYSYQQVKQLAADFILVEGAGGWRLPLGCKPDTAKYNKVSYEYLSDFVSNEKLKVILIVNMKLGCLNHALLTYETIRADGVECIAWIANCASSEPMNNLVENITELEQLLPIPKIAQFDFFADVDAQGNKINLTEKIIRAAKSINLTPLFG